jgi:hypothetical protein
MRPPPSRGTRRALTDVLAERTGVQRGGGGAWLPFHFERCARVRPTAGSGSFPPAPLSPDWLRFQRRQSRRRSRAGGTGPGLRAVGGKTGEAARWTRDHETEKRAERVRAGGAGRVTTNSRHPPDARKRPFLSRRGASRRFSARSKSRRASRLAPRAGRARQDGSPTESQCVCGSGGAE